MMLGLRGTGKTVLLGRIRELAESEDIPVIFLEASEAGRLPEMLLPRLNRTLRKLSTVEAARGLVHDALRAARGFAGVFNVEVGGFGISVDPEPGVADSGDLELDLPDLLESVGRAAKAAGTAVALLVDEVQYLSDKELSALIVAMHHVSQRRLPVLLFGAGLPQLAALSGDAKSYAERLFEYQDIGALPDEAAEVAVHDPLQDEGVDITEPALARILDDTEGYAFFLQEWGYQSWNQAEASPIALEDVELAAQKALKRLDQGFFKVRMDRLTPKEREYVRAMASLPGDGPYRSGDVAEALGEPATRMGPRRAAIIRKGMIYSPAHGDIAFTVPGFKDYLQRVGNVG